MDWPTIVGNLSIVAAGLTTLWVRQQRKLNALARENKAAQLAMKRDIQHQLDQQDDSRTTTRVPPVYPDVVAAQVTRLVDNAKLELRTELLNRQKADSEALNSWIGQMNDWARQSRDSIPSVDVLRAGIDRATAERTAEWTSSFSTDMQRLRNELARVAEVKSTALPDDIRERLQELDDKLQELDEKLDALKSEFDRTSGALTGAGVLGGLPPAARTTRRR